MQTTNATQAAAILTPANSSATALRYDGTSAPRVTAREAGEAAGNILAVTRKHNIPLHENAHLVTLRARLDFGDEVPAVLHTAVAEVIAFACHISGKTPFRNDAAVKE